MRIHSAVLSFIWKLAIAGVAGASVAFTLGAGRGSFDAVALHYFVTWISAAAAVYWLCAAIHVLAGTGADDVLEPSLKYAITMCLGIVLAITHFVLCVGPFYGAAWDLPFFALHYLLPVMCALDWLLFDRKGLMHAWGPLVWTFPVLLYLLLTELLVVGAGANLGGDFLISGVGRYPYPFLDASVKDPMRVLSIVGMGYAFFAAIGYVVYALDRLLAHLGRDARTNDADLDRDGIQAPLSAAPRHFKS